MGKTVQIRNVPEKLHRTLKARATQAGMSISEYLLRELRKAVELPEQDMWERLKSLTPIDLGAPGAELVRAAREERERQLDERRSDEAVSRR
jgi:plasmid stability protein